MECRENLNYYDHTTRLSNRRYFLRFFESKIDEFVIVLLDIDDFQYMNNIYGYKYSDRFLRKFSNRLNNLVGKSGNVFICDSNQFLIVMPKINLKIINNKIKLLQKKLKEILIIDDKEIACSVSMGIYITGKGDSVIDALRKAEVALHEAKLKGKGQYKYFNKKIEEKVLRKAAIINEIKKSIIGDELYLLYQPILDLKEKRITEVEALIRWRSKELRCVSPSEFIPVAEEIGFIREIGYWVINKVCKQIKEWNNQNIYIKVAINISPNQFEDKRLLKNIKRIFKNKDIEFNQVKFEITETQMFESKKENIKHLKKLVKMGAIISLDDFGTGYSSNKNMAILPISEIKIDKCFIDNLKDDKKEQVLVKSAIVTAHELGYTVVAEGVEKKEQFDKLIELGCDKIQGFYIGKPMNENDIIDFLD